MQTDEGRKKNKGGRPQGSMSKLAHMAREEARKTGELPHEFLLRVVRGEIIYRREVDEDGVITKVREVYDFPTRVDAAKASAPYYAPKISTVEVISGVPDDELDAIIKKLAAETGLDIGDDGEGSEDEATSSAPSTGRVRLS